MAIPGLRFELNLDDSGDGHGSHGERTESFSGGFQQTSTSSTGFVKDILERQTTQAPSSPVTPPSLPTAPTATGFPAHKNRVRPSAFKQKATNTAKAASTQSTWQVPKERESAEDRRRREKEEISQENERRLNAMSAEEIEQERKELLAALSPKLIEQLMKRSSSNDTQEPPAGTVTNSEESKKQIVEAACQAAVKDDTAGRRPSAHVDDGDDGNEDAELSPEDRAPKVLPVSAAALPSRVNVHFPAPPEPPDIDPSSPEFLNQLHDKYFPSLPTDPSKLSWMAPISDDEDKSYHPDQPLTASTLRFDFKGNILPPRKARELPVHLGLHHHADAPGAAGYTVPELSHLARSTFPAQRCMAMQTLGRILYRLGTRAYDNEDIIQGLWRCMKEGRVIETLEETAAGKSITHMSVKAYATEAVWNWQLGGGQRWKAE